MATTNETSPVAAESENDDVSDVETEASDVESEVEEASPSDVESEAAEDAEESEAEASEEVEAGASEADASESEVESGVEGEEDEVVKKKKKGKKKTAAAATTTAKGKRTTKVITDITALSASGHGPVYEEDDDDDEDDEADDELYLQKFDKDLRDNYILNFHPEARAHNYEEVKASTKVTRDARGIIIDPLHKTLPFLTKYEMTRIIGQRAKQLDSGAKAFVKVPPNIMDGYHIAQLEIEQKKIPFIIKRPLPNGGIEYWNVNDLEIL